MDQLPSELQYRLALELEYPDLVTIASSSHYYTQLYNNPAFWENKILHDFSLPAKEIILEMKSSREAYIRIAGEHKVPFPGAEKYGNVDELTIEAARRDNLSVIRYFYNISLNNNIFFILGKRNKAAWIRELSAPDYSDNAVDIVGGALAGGHLVLAQEFLVHVEPEDISGWFLEAATESGDIQIVKFVLDLLRKHHTYLIEIGEFTQEESDLSFQSDLEIALAIAVKYKYLDIVYLYIELGAKNLDDSLNEAAKNGDISMVNYLISLNPQINLNQGLWGAAAGGNKEIINIMINEGATDFTQGITSAAYGGHLDILEDFLTRGGQITESALNNAVNNNQLAIVEYLLKKKIFILSQPIKSSIIQDNKEIFSLLISRGNAGNLTLDDMINSAVKGGREKVLRTILKLFFPQVDSTMISRAGHHLNVIVQLINYQVAGAKRNSRGILTPQLKVIYPN